MVIQLARDITLAKREVAMKELTPWFNAKLHSPSHNGWYDCRECDARHYFKDGLWYRNKKSIRDGSMTINEMHWRGLKREPDESGYFAAKKSFVDIQGSNPASFVSI